MFEIEGTKNPDEIVIRTANKTITFNMAEATVDANLNVGKLVGPGEFEVGEATIRGAGINNNQNTIYDVVIGGVHIGITAGFEEGLDEIVADILCTSSVRSVREIAPKLVVAMGNVDGMVSELKLTAKTEKKVKLKKADDLPLALEVIVLN